MALNFLNNFMQIVMDNISEKRFRELIIRNLVAFGPKKYGPNLLLIK